MLAAEGAWHVARGCARVAEAGAASSGESCGGGAVGLSVAALGYRPLPTLPIAVTSPGRAYRSSGSLPGVLYPTYQEVFP